MDAHLGIRSHLDCSSTDANLPLSWAFRRSPSEPADWAAARTPPEEWFSPDGRDLGLKRILLTLLMLMRDRGGEQGRVNRRKAELALLFNTRHLGHHLRPGQVRAARNLAGAVSGPPLFAGHGGAGAALPRHARSGAARHRKMLARRGACRRLPVCRLSAFRPWACDHHAAEVGFFDRPGDGDGTFARALVYRIKPQISEVAGVLAATVGMGLMTLEGPIGSISRGDLLTFGGAVGFRGSHRGTRPFCRADAVMKCWRYPGWRGCVVGPVPGLVGGDATDQWQPLVVWAILITGLLCTALAFTIQAWAQHYTTSTRTALIYALEPVVAWITSFCSRAKACRGEPRRGGAHLGGSPSGRDETVQSAATSIRNRSCGPEHQ